MRDCCRGSIGMNSLCSGNRKFSANAWRGKASRRRGVCALLNGRTAGIIIPPTLHLARMSVRAPAPAKVLITQNPSAIQ